MTEIIIKGNENDISLIVEMIKKTYNVELTDTCLKILSGKEQGEIVSELMSSVDVLKNLMNKKEQNHDKT
ncbi:MAG: hypothetical protein IKS03_07020 [Ruminococcus sp.]|nr:hypothetical protein [Ruminococcus sp.]